MRDGLWTGPGHTFGADFWAAVGALYDTAWPGMSGRIAASDALGATWAAQTTPFVWVDGGRPVAHVGVLAHPVRLFGEDRVVAGIHAVVSHPEARGRGWIRRLFGAVNDHVDRHYDAAKLHTDYPDLYARFGFRVAPLHRFAAPRAHAGGGRAVRLEVTRPDVAERVRAVLAARTPLSDRLWTRDPGWLAVIDSALARSMDRWWHAPPGADWIAAYEVRDDAAPLSGFGGRTLHLHDVVAPREIGRDEVLGAVAEPYDRVVYGFSADRFDPEAAPVPVPREEGVLQVRGRWPDGPPFGVPPTWEH